MDTKQNIPAISEVQANPNMDALVSKEETSDFYITDVGDAYISQRKAAELLGVNDGTLRSYISRNHKLINTFNGLDSKLLQTATAYFAFESRTKSKKAAEFLAQLAEAGAKAFIYRMAGYQIDAKPMQAPAPRELSRMDLIKMAMEAEQERLLLVAQVEEMQPTVAAYDRLTNAENTMTITDAAKQLKLKPTQLREWLIAHKWIYKLSGAKAWTAYQDRIDSGCMMHKTTTIERDGETSIYSQARVTAKGLATISKQIEKARHTTMIVGAAA